MENYAANETLQTIYHRHSIRQFQDTPVEDALIKLRGLSLPKNTPAVKWRQEWEESRKNCDKLN